MNRDIVLFPDCYTRIRLHSENYITKGCALLSLQQKLPILYAGPEVLTVVVVTVPSSGIQCRIAFLVWLIPQP
jgi:hypothetical protein